jgi:DNA-binding transcriptional MerR regulator
MSELMTIGEAAERLGGVQVWRLRRLYERGILREPPRVGRNRVVSSEDLPRLREALRAAGYLQQATA